jgi:hypothetical protein
MPVRETITRAHSQALADITDLSEKETLEILQRAEMLSKQDLGAFLRLVVPGLITKWAAVSSEIAAEFYDLMRKDLELAGSFQAAPIAIDGMADIENVVGYGMSVYQKADGEAARNAVARSVSLAAANAARDTLLINADNDPTPGLRVQRVAEAKACEFCVLMAVASQRTIQGKVTGISFRKYEKKYHAHCHCTYTIVPEGDTPIIPHYYQQFQDEYKAAAQGRSGTKEILKQMRANRSSGKFAIPTLPPPPPAPTPAAKVVRKAARVSKPKAVPAPTAQIPGTQSNWAGALDPKDYPKFWPWQEKQIKAAFNSGQISYSEAFNYIRGRGPTYTTPLSAVANLKVLKNGPDSLEDAVMKNVNPKYKGPSGSYAMNCSRVAQAYELRRRGFDVQASGRRKDVSQIWSHLQQVWRRPDGSFPLANIVEIPGLTKGAANVEAEILKKFPEGARGSVTMFWTSGGGHACNWEVVAGKVKFVDAQTHDLDVSRYFADTKDLHVVRLDDLEPSAAVAEYLAGYEK